MDLTLIVRNGCLSSKIVLGVKAFKRLDIEIVTIEETPEWLLNYSPNGATPTLLIKTFDDTIGINEIVTIIQYLDTLPGPNLYPRLITGQINPLEKAIIDCHIKTKIEALIKNLNAVSRDFSNEKPKKIVKSIVSEIEKNYLDGEESLLHKFLYRNEVSVADVMLFQIVDYLFTQLAPSHVEILNGVQLKNTLPWYNHLKSQYFNKPTDVQIIRL
ncbi:unnamed protein product [Blepharisma stoltei]|uniref:Glutathione S-transferase n=1 Tax=Blepharisma stoltei TaxID=1481888 RepID=A0AAU9IZU0_9CILI|nr:unnamed protein product [Blepharisma stoltei]